MEVTDKTSGR